MDAASYARAGAHVGVITLNRPDNRNSMTPELLDAFAAATAAARADNPRCVVITGSGTSFSAGADFKSGVQRSGASGQTPASSAAEGQRGGIDDRAPHEKSYAMYEPFLSVLDIPVPVVGALQGHAVGGGFGLALVCDIRVGARESKYGANFTKLGLAPGMAISYLLPRLVGVARASELLYTGQLVDGETAERLGILNRAVASADVLATAMQLATEIAANAPLAIRATKRAIRRGLDLHVREAAHAEAFAQAETVASDDAKEGIAALLGKRAPQFTGR